MNDLILFNGIVLTLDERRPRATALAVRDGLALAVGGDAEALALHRDGAEVIDLAGRTVCPGFIDAHHHLTLAAWCQLGVDLAGCHSKAEAVRRIGARAAAVPNGEWLYAFNYAPRRFAESDHLTRYDLDLAARGRPALVMHFSFHEGVVSSAGLGAAGIDRRTRDPFGGRIVRDRHGEPTGELHETAIGPIEALARTAAADTSYEGWVEAAARYSQGLLAAGITRVCDPGADAMLEAYLRRAQGEGRLPVPVTMLPVARGGLYQSPTDRLDGPLAGPVTGDEVDGVSVGALKLFADGGSRCAACVGLFESLAGVAALAGRAAKLRRPALLLQSNAPDRPRLGRDGRLRMGLLHYPPGALAALCRRAHDRGFQVAIHAACNAGIDEAIAALEAMPAGRRQRIEHLVSLDRAQLRRLAATGAIGVVQPAYIAALGDEWEAMPTPPRLRSVPLRDLLDAGVTLAGSSDAPVAPFSPLRGMQAAITRRTAAGLPHQPEQAITPLEALRLWTTGSAQAASLTGEAGVLRPGARADLVVLSHNPLTTPPELYGLLRVERTIIAGRTAYQGPDEAKSGELQDHKDSSTPPRQRHRCNAEGAGG